MSKLERSPWHGMSGAQGEEYAKALRLSTITTNDEAQRNEAVAAIYAKRCALLLVGNDLHGALWAADIAAYAFTQADRLKLAPKTPRIRAVGAYERQGDV